MMSAQSITIEMSFPSVYDNNSDGAQLAQAARLGPDASKLTLRHCCTIFVITDDDDDDDDDDDGGGDDGDDDMMALSTAILLPWSRLNVCQNCLKNGNL